MNPEYATVPEGQLYAAEIVRRVSKLMLQQVKTPHGAGLLISLQMPYNGLYIEPDRADCTVWYSTDKAQSGFVHYTYDAKDILEWNPEY